MNRLQTFAALVVMISLGGAAAATFGFAANALDERGQARQLMKDGNFKDALEKFRELTLDDTNRDSKEVAEDFRRALQCFQQLNAVHEIDEYSEAVAAAHEEDWGVLAAVGQSYTEVQHQGFMIAGEFRRGQHRGGGRVVNATTRDRVRALQLFRTALDLLEDDGKSDERKSADADSLLSQFATAVMSGGDYRQPWRLQLLTDLKELPDYDEGWGHVGGNAMGAPVDEDGNPIFYGKPDRWKDAANDGERWRWLLAQRTEWLSDSKNRELRERADFLISQFGVQTLAEYNWWFARQTSDADTTKSLFVLHTLGDDETIAKLANGIKRFKLPEEQNYIALYQEISESQQGDWQGAKVALAQEFENRRQYPRAAQLWKELVAADPPKTHYRDQFAQIVGNWGRLEPVVTQPAGKGATLHYRFRNGKRVEFTAHAIKVPQLLADLKTYLKGNPPQLQWEQLNIEILGYRLITDGQQKYVGAEAAKWSLDLDPREDYFDRNVTVTTPLQKAGAYLVTAKMDDGNTHSVVVWIADTAIVKKPLENKALYYVADAVTGKPVPKGNVEFFGYWQEHLDQQGNRFRVNTKNYAELTDAAGMVQLPADEANRRFQWLAIATTPQGRLAYLGFSGVWSGAYHDQEYKQVKVFTITDRPVYRPAQEVHFKFWVANAQFDQPDASPFAGQSFLVEIHDPRNEKVHSATMVADAYGGLGASWKLPEGATLGEYRLTVANHGGGSFRVEEYKKPEFEVTIDAPEKPVKLGDKITAKITAKYYFGSPVTEARVKYKVLRTSFNEPWFPPGPWDWLYGPGYWWFAEDYTWYPGWSRWGCARPYPSWIWRQPEQPEVVAEQEAEIGPDGTVEVVIDTAAAKQFHPDTDHSYQIQAEVVDQSRRTITAEGRVLVAREPFRVYVWANRGFYRAGDTIQLDMAARTLDSKPVKGDGVLRLLKIAYEDGKPVENEVGKWDVPTDDQGLAQLQIKASEPGQYRLSYKVTTKAGEGDDKKGDTIEGGQVIVVRGPDFNGDDFRFNDLEIVADKREYAPGDKVSLQVSANRAGAAVLLFLRPANGVYLPPQLVELKGKSTVVEIPVEQRDMPNFFVEAVTVHSGRLHTAVREIFVPPAKRVVDVEVVPSADAFLPGQHAKVQLKLIGGDGKPIVGSTVVAIYDKALDYIAGGGNVPDIREFFWKWRRSHNPQSETNLGRVEGPVVKPNEKVMQNLGVFGESVVDESSSMANGKESKRYSRAGGAGGAMRGMQLGVPMTAMAEGAVAAPMAPAAAAPTDAAGEPDSGGSAPMVQPTIRENFADTALWVGALETNAEGLAEVELDMPENLTTWRINVWGMSHGTRVGEGSAEVVTRKNIIVRLQAPRFFVETDEVVLSANVHNYLKTAKQVRVRLELEGDTLEGPESMEKTVEIPAGGETRVDWRVKAVREGQATIRMLALTEEESDAMQQKFPVLVHGMLKTESFSGVIRPDDTTGKFTFTVPEERRPEQSRLEIRYSPTLAGAMVDALPYLADFPYGCTEQTLNRFLPAVITQKTLQQMGVNLKEIQEKRTNLNAQEIGDAAQRAGTSPSPAWERSDRNPVFEEAELNEMVKAGVNRLTEMQLSDGGWGWFSGWGEQSTAHMTATTVRGLLVARQNDVAIVPGVIERGVQWLQRYEREQLASLDNWDRGANKRRDESKDGKPQADNLDALVYLTLAESKRAGASPPPESEDDANAESTTTNIDVHRRMRDYLYQDRTKLAVYSLATFGLALHHELRPRALPGHSAADNDSNVDSAAKNPRPEAGATDARAA
ncbi:MAG: alpha-2-macroglobulin, partial [Pirellulales bacterium]|nr:alpha-2-macroglobulin [Pirellulales bacterium]